MDSISNYRLIKADEDADFRELVAIARRENFLTKILDALGFIFGVVLNLLSIILVLLVNAVDQSKATLPFWCFPGPAIIGVICMGLSQITGQSLERYRLRKEARAIMLELIRKTSAK